MPSNLDTPSPGAFGKPELRPGPKTPAEERRVKILSLNERMLISVFNWWRDPPHFLALPVTDALPEDCVVIRVAVAWERRCIEALVASAHFPVCPDGEFPERIPGMITEFRAVPFSSLPLNKKDENSVKS